MKPLGNHLPDASKLVAFGNLVLAFAVCSAPARAADDKASCEKELPGFFQVIENLQDDKKGDPEKIDDAYVAANCNDSDRSEVNKNHSTRVDGVDLGGACHASHILIRKHYEKLQTAHADYCEQVEESTKASEQCLGKDSKEDINSCLSDMKDQLKEIKAKHAAVIKIVDAATKELTAARDQNKKVGDKYIEDKHKFDLGKPSENDLVAVKGFEANVDEYREMVHPSAPKIVERNHHNGKLSEGALIDEQRLAGDNITHYLAGLEQYKKKKAAGEDKVNEQIAALSKKAKENNSEGKDLSKYASTAAAAAPAAQSLMNKPGNTAASSSGPGISGAVAAIPAAVALAGMAKSASGASSSAPTLPSGTAPSSHETPATAFAGGTAVASGGRSPASDPNELKTAATEPKKEEAATGSFSPMNLSSDGSSRMGALKKGQKSAEENSVPAQQANYANNGIDSGGGMSMNSHGGSHNSNPAPGTEVTNLLGQMKSLFNFDDPGSGGGNGGGVFGGAMPAMAPGMPGSGEAPQGGEFAENGMSNPETVASNADPAVVEQSALPDNQADSLFVRVHKRHRRYVERGLLTANLGGVR